MQLNLKSLITIFWKIRCGPQWELMNQTLVSSTSDCLLMLATQLWWECNKHLISNIDNMDQWCYRINPKKFHPLATNHIYHVSVAECKTAVFPLLTHWRYCSLQLNDSYHMQLIPITTCMGSILQNTCPIAHIKPQNVSLLASQIAKFTGPTWGPPGSCRPQMGPMLAPLTLLSGIIC